MIGSVLEREEAPGEAETREADPAALFEEARRRQRRRRRALAIAVFVAASGLTLALLALRAGGSRTHAARARPAAATAARLRPVLIVLHGFGTPQQTALDTGSCPQGRTLVPVASAAGRSLGWEAECVLTIRKLEAAGYGIRSIREAVRATYPLRGGTVTTREIRRISFARDQAHTRAAFTGTITGGSGRYAHAHGTVRGGGPGVNERATWKISFEFSSR